MTFSEKLNEIIDGLHITARELSCATGLSGSLISLWRSGARQPRRGSASLSQLAEGLSHLAVEAGRPLEAAEALAQLTATLKEKPSLITKDLNVLLDSLQISSSELGKAVSYDSSYISQIRLNKRRPADPAGFAEEVCRFVLRRHRTPEEREPIVRLLHCPPELAADTDGLHRHLSEFLLRGDSSYVDYLGQFLVKLDRFDLNDYIRSIRFQDIPVVTEAPAFPASRSYYGLSEMKTGELDFLRATAASPSTEPIFMCNDMPMADLASDVEFGKMWMLGLAAALKKGLRFDVIHNVDRPFEEMMLGLESWIPLYMTGQVNPWYLADVRNRVYCHILYCSGAASLSGECLVGKHEHGKYVFSSEAAELAYARQRADDLLQKAHPLMDIYRADSKEAFWQLQENELKLTGRRRSILSVPPIYTLSEDLLLGVLQRNEIPQEQTAAILNYAARRRELTVAMLETSPLLDEVPQLSREEFDQYPVVLPLSGVFPEQNVPYAYEEYAQHMKQTADFAQSHANYSVEFTHRTAFRNIQIRIHEGEYVIISKSQSPTIHFVIRHPKLRAALENMIVPVVE